MSHPSSAPPGDLSRLTSTGDVTVFLLPLLPRGYSITLSTFFLPAHLLPFHTGPPASVFRGVFLLVLLLLVGGLVGLGWRRPLDRLRFPRILFLDRL